MRENGCRCVQKATLGFGLPTQAFSNNRLLLKSQMHFGHIQRWAHAIIEDGRCITNTNLLFLHQ